MRFAFSFVFAAAALVYLYMRFDVSDHVYPMPLGKVNDTIDRVKLPPMVFASMAYNARHWRADRTASVWLVRSPDGAETLRMRAVTSEAEDGVRVHIEALPPEGSQRAKIAQRLQENASQVDLLTTALAEQIDADLTGRDFDMKRLNAAATRVWIEALPHIRDNMDAAARESDRQEQEDVDRAYAGEK